MERATVDLIGRQCPSCTLGTMAPTNMGSRCDRCGWGNIDQPMPCPKTCGGVLGIFEGKILCRKCAAPLVVLPERCEFCTVEEEHHHTFIDVADIERFIPVSLIDEVAMAMVNADIDTMGGCWPWPTGDDERSVKFRNDAREAATIAIQKFLQWKGHERASLVHYPVHPPKEP